VDPSSEECSNVCTRLFTLLLPVLYCFLTACLTEPMVGEYMSTYSTFFLRDFCQDRTESEHSCSSIGHACNSRKRPRVHQHRSSHHLLYPVMVFDFD